MISFNRTIRAGALAALAFAFVVSTVQAQGRVDRDHVPSQERADPFAREQSDIDGNNIRASIFNTGMTGRTGGGRPDEIPYEWPKNTQRHYIALTGIFVGAQVTGSDGNPLYIVDLPRYRTDPNEDNRSWTFEPVAGYTNPQAEAIARSDDPATWPAAWPDKMSDQTDPGWRGSWNGFFGKDIFNADQELYYKMSDDQYDRYIDQDGPTYYPDSTDLTRGGLGLLAETRVLAWSQILINDVVFIIHNVKNDGTEDLRRVGVTLWLADLVGGDGDTADDMPFYDLLEDVAFMSDRDGVGNESYQSAQVGAAIVTFLETPGNAVDRIDNDGDGTTADFVTGANGEPGSPVITAAMLVGEDPLNGVDDNGNGLIDENSSHVATAAGPNQIEQRGVGYADRIDNDGDGEVDGPLVTEEMIAAASGDAWGRWPANPNLAGGDRVHLLGVGPEDLGLAFRDGVDNDDSCDDPTVILSEEGSPRITQEMLDAAAADPHGRYRVNGRVTLYQLGPEDLGRCYADGVDNDGDGAVDEGVDEHIDEMIDESRADGIDNDGDWRPGLDDVGLDGADFTGDLGEGDGRPTSGAGTSLPGEPNLDATDVSESDQIGITNVQYEPSGSYNYQQVSDELIFKNFMVPGRFYDPAALQAADYDLFVSSGLFPLAAGQTERISYAVILGEDNRTAPTTALRFRDLLTKRDNALNAYLADYRFAQAPLAPKVTAVAGNGQVTLYWDAEAERSFDSFLADIGQPAYDFEGYRIYRATDPAFLDAKVITDGFGNQQFLRPLAQYDLIDAYAGFHPVAVNGTQFYMGTNQVDPGEASNGLTHVFVDSTVTNGMRYFYAVTSYDYGAPTINISPSEAPVRIRFEADGNIVTGPNVVAVTPTSSAAGMVEGRLTTGEDGFLPRKSGFTTSRIAYEVVDPTALRDGAAYRIVFEDTLIAGTRTTSDTLTTKNYTLLDVTDPAHPDTLIARSRTFLPGYEAPVVDGFRLRFFSDLFVTPDPTQTGWSDSTVYPISFAPFISPGFARGLRNPADYRIEVGADGSGQSVKAEIEPGATIPARPTNVRIFNETTGEEVEYVFVDLVDGTQNANPFGTTPARFEARRQTPSRSDRILLRETLPNGQKGFTWDISLNFSVVDRQNPDAGDVATVVMRKPFLSTDTFEFTASQPTLDEEAARDALAEVRVVPNPYRGASLFEGVNPYRNGRGEREVRFINLPPRCTIRIFTVSGHLVQVLEHNEGSNDSLTASDLLNGDEAWNLLSRDNLPVAYGVYLYHVEAPGIGETTGKFALIK